jgi:hypothetical protein
VKPRGDDLDQLVVGEPTPGTVRRIEDGQAAHVLMDVGLLQIEE